VTELQIEGLIAQIQAVRRQMDMAGDVIARAACKVSCTCGGANCGLGVPPAHCAFSGGPIGPWTPNCSAGCTGRCDGTLPLGHAGLHSCTHGHPF
jgi:hypothetical protein